VTLAWVETNGQAAVRVSRDGVPVALTTIDASAHGIDQIVWILRPGKLAAISKSIQRFGRALPGEHGDGSVCKADQIALSICRTLGLQMFERNGGDDGTRTRGLCRDRAAF
jgi:hypothetical protein